MDLLLLLAMLPAGILMYVVYKHDTIEREPVKLLIKLFVLGMLSTLPAMLLEMLGDSAVSALPWSYGDIRNDIVMYFVVVALSEEVCKFVLLYLPTRKNREFNYTFDAIVYAVAVGLGFATLENIMYVMASGSVGLAISRGLLAVPLHCTCGVFMGFYYGMARSCSVRGQRGQALGNYAACLVVPVIIHGFYDLAVSSSSSLFVFIGILFSVAMFIVSVIMIKRSAKEDSPVGPTAPVDPNGRGGQVF